jgi:cation diffusion facilitator CzcD-associated flavoprotein CzcO
MNGHANGSADTHIDVAIIGAGISGINAAYRLQTSLPGYSYTIIEARGAVGGTWDLFRYPGLRSDSDLYTFGFAWNPWVKDNPIADGASISKYIRESAAKYGIDRHIRFHHRLIAADWSSDRRLWTLTLDADGQTRYVQARFIIYGSGYYDYNEPLPAAIPGLENFKGRTIHPQFWPEDLDYTDKKVVVIGSGATAVTLVPELAKKASHATMLQRSPTYIVSLSNKSRGWFSWLLPSIIQHKLTRLSWAFTARLFFLFCQAFPNLAKRILRREALRQLPANIPHDPHFKPRYNPWDQRVCFCPDGDFFKALRSGRADIKTDTIRTVTEHGIELDSGETLEADIIVTATGLKMQIAGGSTIVVDGEKIDISEKFIWNGVMLQDVPNAGFVIGYTNASWTLGADATATLICRLLKYMDRRNITAAIPRVDASSKLQPRRLLNLSSTYISVAEKHLPKAADARPWLPRDNYFSDIFKAMFGRLDTGLELVVGSKTEMNGRV